MKSYLLDTNICIFYMKGAIAVAHGPTLLTNNSRHLARVNDILLDDWTLY